MQYLFLSESTPKKKKTQFYKFIRIFPWMDYELYVNIVNKPNENYSNFGFSTI